MEDFDFWNWVILAIVLTPFIFGFALVGLQRRILVRHPASGIVKNGYVGWSWSYLVFGWFVPVYRGEIGVGLFHFVLTCFTFGLFQIIMSFLYNKQYMTRLLTEGWVLADSEENNTYAMYKLNIVSLNPHP